jgi:hypothetical protein
MHGNCAGAVCARAIRPGLAGSPQTPDSPAAFLEACGGQLNERVRQTEAILPDLQMIVVG